jgi:hypothetical protein
MDRGLADWLSRLGPQELVEVLRDVLGAEANRVGAAPGVVHFSREVYRKDGGVDGATDLPASARPIFCPGRRTWQVKSGAGPGTDISDKPRTREHLRAGRDYVLCWSGDDPITPKKEDVQAELQEWLDEHYPGRTATVLTVPDLIRMVEHTPEVVHRHGGPLFLGYTVEEWGRRLRVEEYPFVSDRAREDVTDGLRTFALGTEPYASRHVLGARRPGRP